MNDCNLIIFQPPSDSSDEFKNYCSKNKYFENDTAIYMKFLQNILSNLYIRAITDGLCCLIFPKYLTINSEIAYANIISSGTLGHTWELNDEIVLISNKDKVLGKIAILKKDNWTETISRAERLTHISISSEEKDAIIDSMWITDTNKRNMTKEKIIKWLILSYSDLNDNIHDPFTEYTNSKQICMHLGRKFLS